MLAKNVILRELRLHVHESPVCVVLFHFHNLFQQRVYFGCIIGNHMAITLFHICTFVVRACIDRQYLRLMFLSIPRGEVEV